MVTRSGRWHSPKICLSASSLFFLPLSSPPPFSLCLFFLYLCPSLSLSLLLSNYLVSHLFSALPLYVSFSLFPPMSLHLLFEFFLSFYLPILTSFPIFFYQIMSSLNPNGEHNLAHIYFYLLRGGLCRGESGHAGKEGGLGAGSQCSINQKEWHSCCPWQPSCHPYVCSLPPPSHSDRTTLVMGRVKREEWGGERTLLIKHLRLIVMKCHPQILHLDLIILEVDLTISVVIWVLLKGLQRKRETERERDAVTQIASRRTVPLHMTVMKYNYQRDLLKNSSTAPRPSKERMEKKKILHTKQVLTDQTSFFFAALKLSFQFFSVSDMLSHCKGTVLTLLWKRSANYIKA